MVNLLGKIVRRLSRRPDFDHLIIVAKPLEGTLPIYKARIPFDFEVLPPDIEEVEGRLAHVPFEHRSDIEQRIQHGDRCCVAEFNEQIIYASWTAFGTCYSYALDREYELAKGETYLYSAYTLPKFRGYGIHPAVTCRRLRLLRSWGYKRDLAFIEPKNLAAMRMPEELGYAKVGITGFIEVFGFRWYYHRDGRAFSALKRRNYWQKK